MLILEDLYLGDVHPSERSFKRSSQYAKETLDDEQSELFEEFMTAQREVNVLTDCETFCYAFKLGAKIMLDVLTEGEMKEI